MTAQAATGRFAKDGLPSRYVTEGMASAIHRAYLYGMGLSRDDVHQPFVGVAAAWNGASGTGDAPVELARAVEEGVWSGEATPRTFATVADGSVTGAGTGSLVIRELVADSVELAVRGHAYDGLVGIGSCGASLAGLAMAICRLDVPALIVPLSAPSFGSTQDAYAMAVATEALGLAVPGSASAAGVVTTGQDAARRTGRAATDALAAGIPPRQVCDAAAIANAAAAVAATGAAPDVVLHLAAIGHECGLDFDLARLGAILEATPRWFAGPEEAVSAPGGVPAVLRALFDAGLADPAATTATGVAIGELVTVQPSTTVVPSDGATRHVAGSLASEGALVRLPAGADERCVAEATVFDDEREAAAWVAAGQWSSERALVLRGQGPKGGPAMPLLVELAAAIDAAAPPPSALLVTDGRLPRALEITAVTCVGPEAADDGPLARVRSGDRVELDVPAGTLAADLADHGRSWEPGDRRLSAALDGYLRTVGPARGGAVTHPGLAGERVRYPDM